MLTWHAMATPPGPHCTVTQVPNEQCNPTVPRAKAALSHVYRSLSGSPVQWVQWCVEGVPRAPVALARHATVLQLDSCVAPTGVCCCCSDVAGLVAAAAVLPLPGCGGSGTGLGCGGRREEGAYAGLLAGRIPVREPVQCQPGRQRAGTLLHAGRGREGGCGQGAANG